MTPLDDQLHELFHSTESPVDQLAGDVMPVRARVRRRQIQRRSAAALVAAGLVLVGGVALTQRAGGDRVDISDEGVTTTDPRPSTTTSIPTTSSTERPPSARPSVRDIEFGAATYLAPCPAFDSGPMTLVNGAAENVIGAGVSVIAELGPISYADADGDGNEDAVVVVNCWLAGADSDTGLFAAVYRAGPDGQSEQVGDVLTLEHTAAPSLDGLALTVPLDIYREGDAACCPSEGAEQTWRFDGSAFELESSVEIPPPGAPTRKPPDSETPAAGTCAAPAEPVVEVVIHPDIPSPRCTRVTGDQRLQVRNDTEQEITVSLADFEATLAPGEAELFDQAFVEYLEPGVHRVTVPLYGTSGPEIWLVG